MAPTLVAGDTVERRANQEDGMSRRMMQEVGEQSGRRAVGPGTGNQTHQREMFAIAALRSFDRARGGEKSGIILVCRGEDCRERKKDANKGLLCEAGAVAVYVEEGLEGMSCMGTRSDASPRTRTWPKTPSRQTRAPDPYKTWPWHLRPRLPLQNPHSVLHTRYSQSIIITSKVAGSVSSSLGTSVSCLSLA